MAMQMQEKEIKILSSIGDVSEDDTHSEVLKGSLPPATISSISDKSDGTLISQEDTDSDYLADGEMTSVQRGFVQSEINRLNLLIQKFLESAQQSISLPSSSSKDGLHVQADVAKLNTLLLSLVNAEQDVKLQLQSDCQDKTRKLLSEEQETARLRSDLHLVERKLAIAEQQLLSKEKLLKMPGARAEAEARVNEIKELKSGIAKSQDEFCEAQKKIQGLQNDMKSFIERAIKETRRAVAAENRCKELETEHSILESKFASVSNLVEELKSQQTERDSQSAENQKQVTNTDTEVSDLKNIITQLRQDLQVNQQLEFEQVQRADEQRALAEDVKQQLASAINESNKLQAELNASINELDELKAQKKIQELQRKSDMRPFIERAVNEAKRAVAAENRCKELETERSVLESKFTSVSNLVEELKSQQMGRDSQSTDNQKEEVSDLRNIITQISQELQVSQQREFEQAQRADVQQALADDVKQKLISAIDESNKLHAELNASINELTEIKARVGGISDTIPELRQELYVSEQRVDEQTKRGDQQEELCKDVQQRLSSTTDECGKLRAELKALMDESDKVEASNSETALLLEQHNMDQAKLAKMEEDVHNAMKTVEESKTQAKNTDLAMRKLEKTIIELRQEIQNSHEKVNEHIKYANAQQDLIEDLQLRLSCSTKEASRLNASLEFHKEKVSELQSQLTETKCQLVKLEGRIEHCTSNETERLYKQLHASKERENAYSNRLSELKNEIDNTKRTLEVQSKRAIDAENKVSVLANKQVQRQQQARTQPVSDCISMEAATSEIKRLRALLIEARSTIVYRPYGMNGFIC